MVLEFHHRGCPNKEINATLTFIPKVPNPMELRHIRPISPVGRDYKMLSKNLAKRMRKVMLQIRCLHRSFVAKQTDSG